MSASGNYSSLLSYYLACVEEEDRRSLQISATRNYGKYIIPPGPPGSLFRGTTHAEWSPDPEERAILQRYSLEVSKQRFLYGYPLVYDREGYISPLFFSEAEVSTEGPNSKVRIHLPHAGALQVNLHLFRGSHQSSLERMDLQDFLESPDFGTIDARIAAALAKLGSPARTIQDAATPKGQPGWKNEAILFRDAGSSFTAQLRRELLQLKERSPKVDGTALAALLGTNAATSTPSRASLLEVVPLNQSQRAAVESALTRPLTVVTGPPGTGKSQVVVAILASLGAAGRPVLFASKNNQAVDVVRDRLSELLGDSDWFLRLGSKDAIETELQARLQDAEKIPNTVSAHLNSGLESSKAIAPQRDALEKGISGRADALEHLCALLSQQRATLSKLSPVWLDWVLHCESPDWASPSFRSSLTKRKLEVDALSGLGWPGLLWWLKRFLFGKSLVQSHLTFLERTRDSAKSGLPEWQSSSHLDWPSLAGDFADLSSALQATSLQAACRKAWETIAAGAPAEELGKELRAISEKLHAANAAFVKTAILQRIQSNRNRMPTLLKQYWDLTKKAASTYRGASSAIQSDFARCAKSLLDVVPGIIVTSLSAKRSTPLEPGLFDCIVIDEASQCDIASAIPLILRAKRLVVIGDPKQLRHISSIQESTEHRLATETKVTDLLTRFSYRTKSLFDRAAEALEEGGSTPIFLQDHYRSHPEIVEFSNRLYYKRRLVIRTPSRPEIAQAVFWHDVPAKLADGRGSLVNPEEAAFVRDLAKRLVAAPSFGAGWTLGVVTPYRRQRDQIERLLRAEPLLQELGERLKVGTVHTFQGAETDAMIFSPVVAQGAKPRAAEWLSKEEGLLNVALTRARRVLHIVGDRTFCEGTPGPLGDLARFVNQRAGVAAGTRRDSPAVSSVRAALAAAGLWFQEEFPETSETRTYYLDFVTVGLSGARYNIEVDGRQHYYSPEAVSEDESRDAFLKTLGYQVIRLQANHVVSNPQEAGQLITQLA